MESKDAIIWLLKGKTKKGIGSKTFLRIGQSQDIVGISIFNENKGVIRMPQFQKNIRTTKTATQVFISINQRYSQAHEIQKRVEEL